MSNISGQQMGGSRCNGGEQDRRIFLGQENSTRKLALARIKEMERPRQLVKPRPLIFFREVDSCFLKA